MRADTGVHGNPEIERGATLLARGPLDGDREDRCRRL